MKRTPPMFFFVFRATAVDSSFPDTCQNQVLSFFLCDGLINITKQGRNTAVMQKRFCSGEEFEEKIIN